jgi:hypothetical protein
MKKILLLLFALVSLARAAGTVQQSLQPLGLTGNYALTFYWVGDASSGTVPTTAAILGAVPNQGQGLRILEVETMPLTPAPTAGYGVQLVDGFNGDLMGGAVAGLSATATQLFSASSATPPILGTFSLKISGQAVGAAQGRVVVYFGLTTLVNATAGVPGPIGPVGPIGPTGSGGGDCIAASNFYFSQTPGGTLTGGAGSQTVILSPVPAGINGTDVGHYVYISGGTGTAEAVLVTGGTAVAGAASGTIIFSPLNSHSGAWTVSTVFHNVSGGGGIGVQEAWQSLVTAGFGGAVCPGPGSFNVYATITPPANSAMLCSGSGGASGGAGASTTLNWIPTASKMFSILNEGFIMRDCQLKQTGTATAGSIGIYSAGRGTTLGTADDYVIQDTVIIGFYKGYVNDGGGGSADLHNVTVTNSINDAFTCNSCQGYWDTPKAINNGGNGITMGSCTPGPCGAGAFIDSAQTFNSCGWGVHSTVPLQISGNSFFNNDNLGELYLSIPVANDGGWIIGGEFQYAGVPVAGGGQGGCSNNTTAPAIVIDTSNAGSVTINGAHIYTPNGNGLWTKSSVSSEYTNLTILGAGAGGVAGNVYSILASGSNQAFSNIYANTPAKSSGAYNKFTGNNIGVNNALPSIYFSAGINIGFDQNTLTNVGAGGSYLADSGTTFTDGNNQILGAYTNNGARSVQSYTVNAIPSAILGTSIATGSTITPVAPIFHVFGAGTIKTITVPTNIVGTQVCAIPDNTWSTDLTGNIGLASTAVVGKTLCWTWDQTKWWPSY